MYYRKKPVVVDASQWWKPGDHPAVIHPVPPEVRISSESLRAAEPDDARAALGAIRTLEGWMLVTPGDFVIRGVRGEYYACKPDIFESTYEPADGSQ